MERLPMNNARQEIIAALKRAGKNENGKLHPMSVSQIMAAVERTDRNAVDQLLFKMRKAGEIEPVGRGLYVLGKAPDHHPDQQSDQGGAAPNLTGPDVAAPNVAGNLTDVEHGESPAAHAQLDGQAAAAAAAAQAWVISDADAARRAARYRTTREQRGAWAANRILRWELQDAGVPYKQLQREVDRIHRLAALGH
jgi:hypothetical protein